MKRESRTWETDAFWREVEREIEELDPIDFQAFLEAQERAIEPRPDFEAELRNRLKRFLPH